MHLTFAMPEEGAHILLGISSHNSTYEQLLYILLPLS